MSGKLAPASIILDVTTRLTGIKLGVLNNFIISHEDDNASIKCGLENEVFRVHSQNNSGTIINVQGAGVIFAGDFPHYGVRNIEDDNKHLNDIMEELFKQIGSFIRAKSYKALEKTHNLNELSRLFLKVKPINNKFKKYHLDAVVIGTPEGELRDYPL